MQDFHLSKYTTVNTRDSSLMSEAQINKHKRARIKLEWSKGKNKDMQYRGATSQSLVTKGTWTVLLGMADCLWGRAGHSHTLRHRHTHEHSCTPLLTHSDTLSLTDTHPYTHTLLHTLTHSYTLSPPAQAVHILLRLRNKWFSPRHKSLRYSLRSTKKKIEITACWFFLQRYESLH